MATGDPVQISILLDNAPIDKAAAQLRQKFGSALDGVRQDAARIASQIGQAFSGSVDKARSASRTKEAALEQRHYAKLAEIAARSSAQVQAIEARKQANLASIRARRESEEQKHQQRLIEIARRGAQQSSSFLSSAFSAVSVAGVALAFKSLAETAIGAAVQLDKTRQTLIALTGSADAANAKLAELRKLAATSPGVTTKLATDTFAQLKAIGNIADQTINSVIKSVGKLNAVFTIDDPQSFTRNLVQIFSQGFERADIKEALGRVPIFEQILESAFGTKDASKLRKLKDAGKLTMEAYLTGLSDAIASDPRFENINESIGSRFEKLKDRILTSLAPVGEQIANILLPVIERIAPSIEASAAATARELAGSRAQFNETTESAKLLVQSLEEIAGKSGATIDLNKDFSLLKSVIDGVNIAVNALRDVFELTGAAIEAGVKRFYITPLKIVEFVLDSIGVKISFLSDHLTRVSAQIERATNRLTLGFANAERAENAIAGIESGPAGLSPGAVPGRASLLPRRSERATVLALQQQIDRLNEARGGTKPPASRSSSGSGGRRTASAATDRLSELDQLKQIEDSRNRILSESLRREQDLLENSYRRGLVLTDEYYKNRGLIEQTGLEIELEGLRAQQAKIEEFQQLRKLSNQERNRLDKEFLQNSAEIQVVLERITSLEARTLAERKAAFEQNAKVLIDSQLPDPGDPSKTTLSPITSQVEQLQAVNIELTNAQRFMKGFGDATDTVGDIFDRFGQNVANSFRNVKSLFDGLKSAVKQFFADLVGNTLQNLVRGTLGGLFGGQGLGRIGGGGFGGFGGPGGFGTPPFNPSGSGGILQSIFGGGGIQAPASAGGNGGGGFGLPPIFGGGVPQAGRQGGIQGIIGGLLGKIGLGGVNLGGVFAGAGIGAGLGGQSVLGNILGGIGGSAIGIGLSFGASVLGAGGGLAAAALAALGPAAIIGAPLLVGAILLGRSKQRKKDEQASGDFLQQAIDAINDLKLDVQSDRVSGTDAPLIFQRQILDTFKAQINTLKTKSVRESRLKNQVFDLEQLYQKSVVPEITRQLQRKSNASQLIPEFAAGGIVGGTDFGYDSVLSLLRPKEMVLTVQHQNRIRDIAGPGIFAEVGVPDARPVADGQVPAYGTGGTAARPIGGIGGGPFVIELAVSVGMSQSGAEEILEAAANSTTGENVFVRLSKKAALNERSLK